MTQIMGILNLTPDSFSGDGVLDRFVAAEQALAIRRDGASWVDLGAESSRPGARPITATAELARLVPVLRLLGRKELSISVDTRRVEVARACLEHGAGMINDISGLSDPAMARVVAAAGAQLVIMHAGGDFASRHDKDPGQDMVAEISRFFERRIEVAHAAGLGNGQIILDPGLGFGKTLAQNLAILRNIRAWKQEFGLPLLIGPSRKGFVGTITRQEHAERRDYGTAAVVALAVEQEVDMVRVHNVWAMREVVLMAEAVAALACDLP